MVNHRAEVKNGGLNFVQGGERDGTHWFGGDVIKEAGLGRWEDRLTNLQMIKVGVSRSRRQDEKQSKAS